LLLPEDFLAIDLTFGCTKARMCSKHHGVREFEFVAQEQFNHWSTSTGVPTGSPKGLQALVVAENIPVPSAQIAAQAARAAQHWT